MPSDKVKEQKAKLTETIERLEDEFSSFKEVFESKQTTQNDFESGKINLLEEIKKTKYEIEQLKAQLDIRTEREKLLLDELNELSKQFQTEIDEDTGIATIFLSVTLEHHFEIDVDCSKYPEPPYIFIPKTLDDFFGGKIVLELNTLKKWSLTNPPHLVDIFKELEQKLNEFFKIEEEVIEDRDKLAQRRKFVKLARSARDSGDIEEAINLYQAILEISQSLKDKKGYLKYKQEMQEAEANAKQE